ncbi:hypothetical protein Tco_0589338 [Tanacetum coccineum]
MARQHIKVRLENDMNGVLIQRTLSLSQKLKPGHPTVALPKHLGNTKPIRAHPLDLRRQAARKESSILRNNLVGSTAEGAPSYLEAGEQDFTSTNCLSFDEEDRNDKGKGVDKRAEDIGDEDLQPNKDVSVDVRWSDNRLVRPVTKRLNRKLGRSLRKVHKEISAFMSNSKCLELGRYFSDQVPNTVTEMMKRVDGFIKSEEFYKSTQLPRGEFPENRQGTSYHHYQPYVPLRANNQRYDNRRQDNNHLSLDALTKRQKEILATELQLQLPPCTPMVGTPKKENLDQYCDYHGEKGHYTND